jgi:hypothetical protein
MPVIGLKAIKEVFANCFPKEKQAVAPITLLATELRIGYKFGIEGNPYIRAGDVYMGLYEPTDRKGRSLGRIFHLFAAQQLRGVRTFNDTSEYLGESSDGFRITKPMYYDYDRKLIKAFVNGSIRGKRFISPLELVNGRNAKGWVIRPEGNLLALKGQGDFNGSYTHSVTSSPLWILSSSPHSEDLSTVVSVDFLTNRTILDRKNHFVFSCRPVRVVEPEHLILTL